MNIGAVLNKKMDLDNWLHPDMVEYGMPDKMHMDVAEVYCNPNIPFEERSARAYEDLAYSRSLFEEQEKLNGTPIPVPGCPEEPDTGSQVTVCRPTNIKNTKKKLPCLVTIPGGGLYSWAGGTIKGPELADEYGAVVVICRYRTIFEGGGYPQTINDLHACYKWVVDNAAELGINPDKIVLHGSSSGGHLVLALCHRLKKYGYRPRGCVAEVPIPDERTIYPSSRRVGSWGGRELYASSQMWLGPEHANSASVPAEAFANHATVEECVGLPPTYIMTGDLEVSADSDMAYASKLIEAGVHTELHIYGGCSHAPLSMAIIAPEKCDMAVQYLDLRHRAIAECFKHDLRRPWVADLLKEAEN